MDRLTFLWRPWSLVVKLALMMTAVMVATVVSVTLVSLHREQQAFRAELEQQAELLLNTFSAAISDPLYTLDVDALSDLMKGLGKNQLVVSGRVYDASGRIVADAYDETLMFGNEVNELGRQFVANDGTTLLWQPDQLVAGQAVIIGRERVGAISLGLSTTSLTAKMNAVRDQGFAAALAAAAVGSSLALLALRRGIVRPITTLSAAAGAVAAGDLDQAVKVTSADEVGQLQRAFNSMAATIQRQTQRLERQVQEAKTAWSTAETARAEIAAQLATIEEQRAVIREMSVPILPLTAQTVVMPLVGALDAERLGLVQSQALRAIEQESVRFLIVDITGVPVVDAAVAAWLTTLVAAARLLGTQVLLVGIRPEVAQALVGAGLSLGGVTTRSSLQEGISYVLGRQLVA